MAQCLCCYGDDRNGWKAQFENSGYCVDCVTMHSHIREAALCAIESRKGSAWERELRVAKAEKVEALVDAFKADALRAANLAMDLPADEKTAFVERAEKAMDTIARTYYSKDEPTGENRPELIAMRTWLPYVQMSARMTKLCASLDAIAVNQAAMRGMLGLGAAS